MNRDFPKQRLITGRAPETYEWKDGRTRPARPVRAGQSAASRAKARPTYKEREAARLAMLKKKRKDALLSNALMYLTVVFIVFMLFMQIGKLSEISGKRNDIDNIMQMNSDLLISIENLEVEYGFEKDEDVIKQKAADKLHMKAPLESGKFVLKDVSRGEQSQYLTADGDAIDR